MSNNPFSIDFSLEIDEKKFAWQTHEYYQWYRHKFYLRLLCINYKHFFIYFLLKIITKEKAF